jgi:hypothetical protein
MVLSALLLAKVMEISMHSQGFAGNLATPSCIVLGLGVNWAIRMPPMMKKSFFLAVLMVVMVLAACKKDDVIDDPGTGPLPETSIAFTCQDSLGIADVLVGISPQEVDRDNGVFLKSGLTDAFGKIKFTGLDPQTFFYSASRTTTSGIVKRKGSVLVDKDEKQLVTITF